MQLWELKQNTPKYLLGVVSSMNQTYGDKFEKFSELIYRNFQKIARINFAAKVPQKQRLPLALLAAILFMKNDKLRNEDYTALEFIDTCKPKLKELASVAPQLNLTRLLDHMKQRIAFEGRLQRVVSGQQAKTLVEPLIDLMNGIAEAKGRQVENYSQEQMKKISGFFGERVFLINYDYNKGALTDRVLSHKCIYLLKAKELYFLLFKEQDIQHIEREAVVTHEELASIFKIQNKLERVKPKGSQQKSPTKGLKQAQPPKNSDPNQGEGPLRLKNSTLFPDEVKCAPCGKICSEFAAIFWNYSHYCLECVMDPKVDISFIPSSIIEKFLRNQKMDSKEYSLICSECKSDTIIGNYRPWDKPKCYKCKVCLKDICVEHQKMIGQCFCHCQACDRRTLTIAKIYAKVCLTCRMRFCEVCQKKNKGDCKCICKQCGENMKVIHEECKPRCHQCEATEVTLNSCTCGRKLCGVCCFSSLDPNSSICGNHAK